MKKISLFAAAAVIVCACAPKTTVTIDNTLTIDRSAELVEIPTSGLRTVTLAEGQTYVVTDASGEVIPSQVTHDGLLVFQSGLGAGEETEFKIEAGAPREFPVKTRARFAPERFDDMIWENDRVAFRIYGAALMAKDGPSNGIDALYKRSADMVIDRWYVDELQNGLSYHDDHGTGLDDYNVKRTLGAGGAAPFLDGKLILNTNFTGHEILDNGPLRSTFRLTYPDLEINGAKVSETRTFSIDAGSQLTRVTQEYGVAEPVTVAMGFPMRTPDVNWWLAGEEALTLVVEEPSTQKSSGVLLGAVLPSRFTVIENEYEIAPPAIGAGFYRHILARVDYTPGTPFTYYTGFGWEKWGDWTAEGFNLYLSNFAKAVRTPLVVTIN